MLKKLGILVLFGASLFAMHNVELNINEVDLEFETKLDMGQFVSTIEPELVFIGAKILHADKKNSDIANASTEDLDDYYEINFLMQRHIDNTDLMIGLGVKLNASRKFASIPLGLEVGYMMPFARVIPMSLHGEVYYAPDVLALRDAKNFLEYRIFYDIEVIKNATITMGYRSLNTYYVTDAQSPYLSKDIKYNSAPYVGFKFLF